MFIIISAPVVIKQQARIERLKIELNMEKAQLIVMQREIAELQNNQNSAAKRTDEELEKQLLKEIQHLRCQCERLQGESNSLPEWSGKSLENKKTAKGKLGDSTSLLKIVTSEVNRKCLVMLVFM